MHALRSASLLAITAVAAVAAVATGSAPTAFELFGQMPPAPYRMGFGPLTAAIGDFDGDGRPDIAVANAIGTLVSVRLTGPDGVPGAETTIRTEAAARAIAAGDFDEDGRDDIIVLHPFDDSLSIAFAQPGGGFDEPRPNPTIPSPRGLILADFNDDGHLDFAHGSATTVELAVYLGDGDGMFFGPIPSAVAGAPTDLAASDFDADGWVDLAAIVGDSIVITRGAGDGTFQPVTTVPVDGTPLALGHFGPDDPALAVLIGLGGSTDRAIAPLRRTREGQWVAVAPTETAPCSESFIAVDIDLDGDEDLVVAAPDRREIVVHRQSGSAEFESSEPYAFDGAQYQVAAADIDGDGAVDLVIAEWTRDRITIADGDGGGDGDDLGGLQLERRLLAGRHPTSVTAADFDGDGVTDLATIDASDGTVSVHLGLGAGRFGPRSSRELGAMPTSITHADLDADGHVDLAFVTGTSLIVLPGNGDGSFGERVTRVLPGGPGAISVADIDGDGIDDLVTPRPGAGVAALVPGDIDALIDAPTFVPVASWSDDVAIGDLDGDGDLDVVTAGVLIGGIVVTTNQGDGVFVVQPTVPIEGTPRSVELADVDQDGRLDVITALLEGGVALLRGMPDGSFSDPAFLADAAGTIDAQAHDANGDGRLDIVSVNDTTNDVSIAIGLADGTFEPAGSVTVLAEIEQLVIANVDGRHADDLVLGGSAVTILMANAPPATGACPADLDADGTVDFLDLLQLLASWGPNPGAPADFDGNGHVDFEDLLGLLALWGAC